MRTIKFRDVLWAIAYKLGFDPETNFQKNQAAAIATYINAWVRRLWDATDWPEWTVIYRYAPDDNHYLSWDAMPNDFIPISRPPLPPARPWKIGRPLKLYLLDPITTWAPVDTPFRATELGIHCGFEHGSNIWLKFMPPAPQYTSREWGVATTYSIDDLVYWPVTGECYSSKINNNVGHEPDDILTNQSPVNVEEIQSYTPPNPGSPAVNGIYDVVKELTTAGAPAINGIYRVNQRASSGLPIPDPLIFATNTFTVSVFDASNTLIGQAVVNAAGGTSLGTVWSQLASTLLAAPGLAGFDSITVATESGSTFLRIEDDSMFTVTANWEDDKPRGMQVVLQQAYQPPAPNLIDDPPPIGSVFLVEVRDASNVFLGDATVTANGTDSLTTIWNALRTQLLAEALLVGFTITIDADGNLQVEHASGFTVAAAFTQASNTQPIRTIQEQAYQPAVAPTPMLPQILRLIITQQQVIPNAVYQLTFRTGDNVEHSVSYTSEAFDNALAILTGLVNAITVAQSTDPFFQEVNCAIDTVGPSVTFTIGLVYGEIGLNASIQPPGTIYWEAILFPLSLVDQVIRGAVADMRGEQGQTDKEQAEEQKVPTETQLRIAAQLAPEYDALSDQQKPKSRYAIK